jgi:hypothetical protein
MSDAGTDSARYSTHMLTTRNMSWPDVMAPLLQHFGDRLAIFRERDRVIWTFDKQSAIVELRAREAISALFIDRPVTDVISSALVGAMYRASGVAPQLTVEGAMRLVDDMVAFFSGVREPRFSFVSAYEVEAA